MEAEAGEKIRIALKVNVRTYADEHFIASDQIYY